MRSVEKSARYSEVVRTFEEMGFGQFIKSRTKINLSLGERPAKRLRKAFEKLGGGFALIGIYLSHRLDLLDEEYCKEFNQIKDTAIRSSFSEIEKTIIKSYSRPVNTIFEKMWDKPDESYILTQIHKAELINGEMVFVEVIKEKNVLGVKEDIKIMKYLSDKSSMKEIKKIIKEFEEHFENKKTLTRRTKFLKNSAKAYGSNYLPIPKEHLCNEYVLMFTYDKNIAKNKDLSKHVEREISVIKGEILIFIIGVLIVVINFGITKLLINIPSLIGLSLILIALLISIREKISR